MSCLSLWRLWYVYYSMEPQSYGSHWCSMCIYSATVTTVHLWLLEHTADHYYKDQPGTALRSRAGKVGN